MQQIQRLYPETAMRILPGRKTVLVAGVRCAELAEICRDFGMAVEMAWGHYDALAAIADDPKDYGALVLDCDGKGGFDACDRIARLSHIIAPQVLVLLVAGDKRMTLQATLGAGCRF